MKINIEDYLQQIDASFKEKSQKDVYMIYVMIFGAIFAFSYLLFWESSEKDFSDSNRKIEDITAKINLDRTYLSRNPQAKITLIERDIKLSQAKLIVEKNNNDYIKSKIEAISSLIYDERTWGEYLHSISRNAKKYNVTIRHFTNEYAKNDKSFGHILDIVLETTGSYKNTLKFINSLEKSDLVVDIHAFNIKAQNKLNSHLNISVWGITY